MKIIIIGAGELGRLLAARLCEDSHDVTIIDSTNAEFERLKEQLDLMVIEGTGTSVSVLKEAGAESADILLAVSGDEAVNMVACRLAEHLGVKRTICRTNSTDIFSGASSVLPEIFGIWKVFSPDNECALKIMDVLNEQSILEQIRFSNPDALMVVIGVDHVSPLAGTRIIDITGSDLLNTVRFAGIVRGSDFIVPHGDTIIAPGDKIYISGHREKVLEFVKWEKGSEGKRVSRIVIAGAAGPGKILAQDLAKSACDVRVIERNKNLAEKLLDGLPRGFVVINGDPTDETVLEEAGVRNCDVYISSETDDENNILSCIMAKRMGAAKVVTVTRKPEYIGIVPAMEQIDCGFSSTLISVNTIFRLMESGTVRIDAKLQRFHAYLTEFKITEHSPLCGKTLAACKIPASAVFAMIFRCSNVFSPSGSTVFQQGDTVVAIVTPESAEELRPLFPR